MTVRARVVAAFPRALGVERIARSLTESRAEQILRSTVGAADPEELAQRLPDPLLEPLRHVALVVEGIDDPEPVLAALRKHALEHRAAGSAVLFVQTSRYDSALMQSFAVRAPAVFDAVKRALASFGAAPDLALGDGRVLRLHSRAHLMGIVNVTPDSFSDGGMWLDPDTAVKHALRLVEEGADILDIGGESTRPGADPVPADEEIRRVVAVIERIVAETRTPVSIDTMKAPVAAAALDAGAAIVNDVSAGRADPDMLALCAERRAPVVLMHMRGDPRTMQADPRYDDVVGEVYAFLAERVQAAHAAGVPAGAVVVDPGFGFGKTRGHNLVLLDRLREFTCLGAPVLAGTSRKSFIGTTLDLPVEERLEGTAATVALAVANGAAIVRVHDVAAMRRVAGMVEAVVRAGAGET